MLLGGRTDIRVVGYANTYVKLLKVSHVSDGIRES